MLGAFSAGLVNVTAQRGRWILIISETEGKIEVGKFRNRTRKGKDRKERNKNRKGIILGSDLKKYKCKH